MNFFEGCLHASRAFADEVRSRTQRGEFATLLEKGGRGAGGDISLYADLLSESFFCEALADCGMIYSEESGRIGEGERIIYLDPIDGSDNFAARIPYYGVSAALMEGETHLESFVCNFANGDFFYRKQVLVSGNIFRDTDPKPVEMDICCPKVGIYEKAYSNPHIANRLREADFKFRNLGAIALSLAYVRNVSFCLYTGTWRKFDIMAGLHLAQDCHIHLDDRLLLVAKDKRLFDELLKLVITL